MHPNRSKFPVLQRRISERGENKCLWGYEYGYESKESLTKPRQRKEVSLSKREKEIKENTRWGLYNFLTKVSLQCQESQIRGCFLGRRKSPRSPSATSQPRRRNQQAINPKIFIISVTPTNTNLTPPMGGATLKGGGPWFWNFFKYIYNYFNVFKI